MNHDLDRSGTDDRITKDKFANDSFGETEFTDRPALSIVWVFAIMFTLILGLLIGSYLATIIH